MKLQDKNYYEFTNSSIKYRIFLSITAPRNISKNHILRYYLFNFYSKLDYQLFWLFWLFWPLRIAPMLSTGPQFIRQKSMLSRLLLVKKKMISRCWECKSIKQNKAKQLFERQFGVCITLKMYIPIRTVILFLLINLKVIIK